MTDAAACVFSLFPCVRATLHCRDSVPPLQDWHSFKCERRGHSSNQKMWAFSECKGCRQTLNVKDVRSMCWGPRCLAEAGHTLLYAGILRMQEMWAFFKCKRCLFHVVRPRCLPEAGRTCQRVAPRLHGRIGWCPFADWVPRALLPPDCLLVWGTARARKPPSYSRRYLKARHCSLPSFLAGGWRPCACCGALLRWIVHVSDVALIQRERDTHTRVHRHTQRGRWGGEREGGGVER